MIRFPSPGLGLAALVLLTACGVKQPLHTAALEALAEAQAEGHLEGMDVDFARSVVNQMVATYLMPYHIAMLGDRLSEDKLAHIVDAIFDGLVAKDGGARSTKGLHAA